MPYFNKEQARIQALFKGDPRANFANWVPEGEEAGVDLRQNPASYNQQEVTNPSRGIMGERPMLGDMFKPQLTYQDAIRNRLGSISGLADQANSVAFAPKPVINTGGGVHPDGYQFKGKLTGNKARDAVLKAAASQKGMPYSWGGGNSKGPSYGIPYKGKGSEKIYGFDCSGLVQYAFAQAGFKMPRWGGDQRAMGQKTSISKLVPGDLVGKPGHVAIYAGNGMMWEAPTFGKAVRLVPVRKGMFGIHINY